MHAPSSLKTLSSLAVATLLGASAFAASAQSTVTVYGVVDMYLQYGKGSSTQTQIQSGGVSGSRLGFKGTEDLGDGLKAVFLLESGINADTGSYGQGGLAFGRQAYVGLNSATLGAVTLGRQYVPHYNLVDSFDPFGTGAGSAAESGVVSISSRANNSVVYQSPTLAGFSGAAMVSLSENTTTPKSNGNLYSISGQYANGPFSAGLAWRESKRATNSLVDSKYLLATAAYDFGVLKLTGGAQTVRNLNGAETADRSEAFAGILVPVGNDTVSAGFGASKTKDTDGGSAQQWTLGYAHPLSKRTKVYAFLTHINNGSLTSYTATAATGDGPVTTAGQDVSALLLGIRHAF